MSHYLPQETAKHQDSLALDRILALDPEGLFTVVREAGITMLCQQFDRRFAVLVSFFATLSRL